MGTKGRENAPMAPDVFAISSDYMDRRAALDPVWATSLGIPGHDGQMTDYSPDGVEARADLQRSTRVAVAAISTSTDHERIAANVLLADLETELAVFKSGTWQADLNILASPLQDIRDIFELMGDTTEADWVNRRDRLSEVPAALDGYRRSLSVGLTHNQIAARRQALQCAFQCDVRADQFVTDVVGSASPVVAPALREDLKRAAERARAAYASFGTWLRNTYAPQAREADAVGVERYTREVPRYLGTATDLENTYRWGLDQVNELRAQMILTADGIMPGGSLREVEHLLETDPARAVHGEAELVEFLQAHMDQMLDTLDGKHFEIAPNGRRVEQMIAPPGGAEAQYYTPPTSDWSRPGRCWFPVNGRSTFPVWGEITTANHEGVPGHHLQAVASLNSGSQRSRFQKQYFMSGHGEGWALYAERLCFELGLLEKPDYVLGWLSGQMLRAVRVVVDIGMHCGAELGIRVPGNSPVAAGLPWDATTGLAYAREFVGDGPIGLESEIDRYLGLPAQAISYKVGEREWLATRSDVRKLLGSRFDLKQFHTVALGLGAMGLDQLRYEVLRAFQ